MEYYFKRPVIQDQGVITTRFLTIPGSYNLPGSFYSMVGDTILRFPLLTILIRE